MAQGYRLYNTSAATQCSPDVYADNRDRQVSVVMEDRVNLTCWQRRRPPALSKPTSESKDQMMNQWQLSNDAKWRRIRQSPPRKSKKRNCAIM
jgi:hypothetical protein